MTNKDIEFEVVVTTNMCECIDQTVVTETCTTCNKLRYRVNDEMYPDHYGPYGANCMNTGQFDAGECWMCYARRKKQEAADMQLVAGRYQFMHEHAQKALNTIDDQFEYAYTHMSGDALQAFVRNTLAKYTEAVSKIAKR